MQTFSLKIKPFADAIRAKVATIPVLGCAVFQFAPGEWAPTARFWTYTGERFGFVLSIRNHGPATYVFRIE